MYDYGYETIDYSTGTDVLGVFGAIMGVVSIATLVISIVVIVSQWKIFKKAGKGGWESIIPIYNTIVQIQIAGLPIWYIVLFLVPIANIYAMFKIYIELAHKFGKSTGFGVAMAFFPFICQPILAFSKNCVYNGPMTNNNNNEGTIQNNNPQPVQNQNTNELNNNMDNNNSNVETPITFDQNINTQINPIQNNFANNMQNTNQLAFNQASTEQNNNLQPELNPNSNNNTEVQQSFQYNNQNTEVNTETVPQPVTFNPLPSNENNTPQLNVIPNAGETPQPTVDNNQETSSPMEQPNLFGATPSTEQNLNVIPNMGTTPMPVENNELNNLTNQINPVSPQPASPTPVETQNTVASQGLNVIPGMGTNPQPQMSPQNPGYNQNNTNM